MNKQPVIENGELFIFNCPHCLQLTEVLKSETACCIFRHAVEKKSMQQINPHSPKNICDELVLRDLVYGCAKPFKFIYNGIAQGKHYVEICDYD